MADQKAGYQRVEIDGVAHHLHVPNNTMSGAGFYVSYNAHDENIYGDVTTALVRDQMDAFYILNGNHMRQYAELIDSGFDACLAYFEDNIDQINKYSDRVKNAPSAGMSR
jgi:hypothetical protein